MSTPPTDQDYPSGAKQPSDLNATQQSLKVARHSKCDECNCQGIKPHPQAKLSKQDVTESEYLDPEEAKQIEEKMITDWSKCHSCQHPFKSHSDPERLDAEERLRRVKVAVRLDELLEDKGKLLDFDYSDQDIVSLRKQMTLPADKDLEGSSPTSQLSPAPEASPSPESSNALLYSTPLTGERDRKRKTRSRSRSDSPITHRERETSVATSSRLSSPELPNASNTNSREGTAIHFGSPSAKRRKIGGETEADRSNGDIHGETNGKVEGGGDVGKEEGEQDEEEEGEAKEDTEIGKDKVEDEEDIKLDGESLQPPPPKSAASAVEEGLAPKKEKPAIIEERTGLIQFRVVTNDDDPESMILLTGLKNIFQRQLPKMPREYITRLVLDRNHHSLAIVKRGLQVVGGITYRPFKQRTFAEIVFCAITSTEQVKGYGSHLMNHLKDHVKATTPIMHFLTYADNYAIGYFKKQGFTKEINLDRSIWVGYIKDYEGGTLMQCSMVPRVAYLQVQDMLAAQKEAVLAKIRMISRSHVIHKGISAFRDKEKLMKAKGLIKSKDEAERDDKKVVRRGAAAEEGGEGGGESEREKFLIDPSMIPGLKESGWTPEMDELSRRPKRGPQFAIMRHILVELNAHGSAWPFVNPVNGDEVTDYYQVIKNPMDLSTMENKLENNKYANIDELVKDAKLIFDNCRSYNPASSPYAKCATKLEKFLFDTLLPKVQASLP